MRTGSSKETKPTIHSTSFSSSWQSNQTQKYGGMIESTWSKKTERNFIQLFSYIHTVAPKMYVVHAIVSILRLFQLAIPFLQPCEKNIWGEEDGLAYQVVSYFSILSVYFPLTDLQQSWFFVLIAFAIIKLVLLILFYVSANVYSKTAMLPAAIPIIITIYTNTIGILLETPCFYLIGYLIGRIIYLNDIDIIVPVVILGVINIVLSTIHYQVFVVMSNENLLFYPFPLQTVLTLPQKLVCILEVSLNFTIGFAFIENKIVTIAVIILLAIQYGFLFSITFIHGGFINRIHSASIGSIALTGILMCVIEIFCIIFIGSVDLVFLWIIIALFIVILVAYGFLRLKLDSRTLEKLDYIAESNGEFGIEDMFKSVNSVINSIVIGFRYVHQSCLDWSFFKNAVELWPRNITIWTLFAKFIAIYPMESSTLSWIFHSIKKNRIKGSNSRSVKQNIISIMRQRESMLTPELKGRINVLTRATANTRLKLRHVWDAVIQGNTGDVEMMSKIAIAAVQKLDTDFKHILRQFPNNRFVTRVYATFLHDVASDHDKAMVFQERSKSLGRGTMVVSDEAHELGMITFPQIPDRINTETSQNPAFDATLNLTATEDIEPEEVKNELDIELLHVLKQRLNTVYVPTIRNLVITRVVIYIVFLAPFIYFAISGAMFSSSLDSKTQMLNVITIIRNYNTMMPMFVEWYIFETMGVVDNPGFDKMHHPMESLENSTTAFDIVNVMVQMLSNNIQDLERALNSFETDHPDLLYVYEQLSGDVIPYTIYATVTNTTLTKKSVQGALLNIVQSCAPLSDKSLTKDEIKAMRFTGVLMNPLAGSLEVNHILNDVMSRMMEYLKSFHEQTLKSNYIIIGVLCAVFVIIQLVYQILEIKFLVAVKIETYKSLIALPKNVVSQIAESMRMIKKGDSTDVTNQDIPSDINKQEENILKVLATSGSNAAASDVIIFLVTIILETLMICLCFYLTVFLQSDITLEYLKTAPHIHYFVGSFSMRVGAYLNLFNLAIDEENDPEVSIFHNTSYWYEWGPIYLLRSQQYNDQVRFGGSSSIEFPFRGYAAAQEVASSLSSCESEYEHFPINDFTEYLSCYNSEDIQAIHTDILGEGWALGNATGTTAGFKVSDFKTQIERLYLMLVFSLYDEFYFRNFNAIIPEMEDIFAQYTTQNILIASILCVIALICELIHIWRNFYIEKHIKDVLRLLLQCPVSVIFQTPKIIQVLNNDFSGSKRDMTLRNEKFFMDVIEAIPDVIINTRTDFTITSVNITCTRLLGKEKEDIVGKTINSFFAELGFEDALKSLTPTQNQSEVLSVKASFKKENELIHIVIEMSHVNNGLVYVIRDNTQTVRYNTLIAEERAKSDALLSSILPASLVPRVQAGEKNISFAVQSATVLFLDVVSFTPWCGANTAKTVMDTLNLFFKKLDHLVATYPAMTKIKCIGDCYMCAGGIFMDVNQPTEHARQVVSFGLDALDALQEVNNEMNQELQIRVGINSGGPLVAGVLGVGKPTFEILGPAINLAQQMEHHGVPSKVHISRSVYELIYGDSFAIKERGTIEVKQGKVNTYIVERKK